MKLLNERQNDRKKGRARRYALRENQWGRIKDLLPERTGHVGVTARDNRLFAEAVLGRYRAGIAWRDFPERFGDFAADTVLADKAFDADARVIEALEQAGKTAVIPEAP